MKNSELKSAATTELVKRYNQLMQKRAKMPKHLRRNAMPKAGNTCSVLLEEIQQRAINGDNQLSDLAH